MSDTNYFSGIIKILENPTQSFINDKTLKTTIRAEIPQIRKNKIISLVFWGNLANEINNYYQINDYILIEGYSSIVKKDSELWKKTPSKMIITVLKIYPFLLNSKQSIKKI